MAKILIDAGHGGSDCGAIGYGRKEADDTLKMAKKIGELLKARGVTVFLPDTADIDLANRENCDYFLSIHRDAFSDKSASGATMYIYSKASAETTSKARKIYAEVIAASGFRARGLKKGAANYTDYAVNRDTTMSAGLLELGFITNENDNNIFDIKFNGIAEAIAKALCSIVGVKYEVKKEVNVTSYPTIRNGSTGAYVVKLQARRNALGFNGGKADGIFGAKTQ